jgi:hypothetical protein
MDDHIQRRALLETKGAEAGRLDGFCRDNAILMSRREMTRTAKQDDVIATEPPLPDVPSHSNSAPKKPATSCLPSTLSPTRPPLPTTDPRRSPRPAPEKLGKDFAHRVKVARRKPGSTWHPDEMFVTLRGEPYLLWRAVDEHGAELDILSQERRDKGRRQTLLQACAALEPGAAQDRYRSVA